MNPEKRRNIRQALIVIGMQIMIIAAAFAAGYFSRNILWPETGQFPVLFQVHTILKDNALNDLPEDRALEYGMIRGLLQAFGDPFTVFVEAPQHELQANQLEGKFGGIGTRVELDAEGFIRLFPYPESPSQKAGILDGDRLIAVDDWRIPASPVMDEVSAAVRGPIGEPVTLTILRQPDSMEFVFEIIREEVAIPSVTFNLVPDEPAVGIVHVSVIAATTTSEVSKAIVALQAQGASRIILDLRNNGGGLVDAGVDLVRLFLSKGDIISQQYRNQPVKTFDVERTGEFSELPLVVLVNSNTASASEIVAGALQAQDRALLIGQPTYGKHTIQLVFELLDGSSLHVTSARWWVPGFGEPDEQSSLSPDLLVSSEQAADEAFLLAIAVQELMQEPAISEKPE